MKTLTSLPDARFALAVIGAVLVRRRRSVAAGVGDEEILVARLRPSRPCLGPDAAGIVVQPQLIYTSLGELLLATLDFGAAGQTRFERAHRVRDWVARRAQRRLPWLSSRAVQQSRPDRWATSITRRYRTSGTCL